MEKKQDLLPTSSWGTANLATSTTLRSRSASTVPTGGSGDNNNSLVAFPSFSQRPSSELTKSLGVKSGGVFNIHGDVFGRFTTWEFSGRKRQKHERGRRPCQERHRCFLLELFFRSVRECGFREKWIEMNIDVKQNQTLLMLERIFLMMFRWRFLTCQTPTLQICFLCFPYFWNSL